MKRATSKTIDRPVARPIAEINSFAAILYRQIESDEWLPIFKATSGQLIVNLIPEVEFISTPVSLCHDSFCLLIERRTGSYLTTLGLPVCAKKSN
jgi:hypothetical protein